MPRLGVWIGASTADICVRLAAQMLATVVIARLLPAEDFGLAMLALSVAALLGAFIGLPFEEALAQKADLDRSSGYRAVQFAGAGRRRSCDRDRYLRSARPLDRRARPRDLAASFNRVLARAGSGLHHARSRAPPAQLRRTGRLPIAVRDHCDRRRHRACLCWLGVLALVLQRMLPIALYPVLGAIVAIVRGRSPMVAPIFVRARFDEMFRFSWLYFGNTAVHYAIPAAMTFLVNMLFGTRVLGQLNIAMRLAEPVRQGVQGVGHNLVFSLLTKLRAEPRFLVREAIEVSTRVASIAVPSFLGLAVVAPFVLPILAGPGWDDAVPLAQAFCLVAAINAPFLYIFSGFSALGRPEYELTSCILALLAMVGLLLLAAELGSTRGIGVAVIGTEIVLNGTGLIFVATYLGAEIREPLFRILRIWLASGVMTLALAGATPKIEMLGTPIPALIAIVIGGVLLYPPLLFVFCRPCFEFLEAMVLRRKGFAS